MRREFFSVSHISAVSVTQINVVSSTHFFGKCIQCKTSAFSSDERKWTQLKQYNIGCITAWFRSWIRLYFGGGLWLICLFIISFFLFPLNAYCLLVLVDDKNREEDVHVNRWSVHLSTLYNQVLLAVDSCQECHLWHRKLGRTVQLPGKAQETRTVSKEWLS